MNSVENEFSIKELFCSGRVFEYLQEYILWCEKAGDSDENEDATQTALCDGNSSKERKNSQASKSKRKQKKDSPLFPNLAGFCRYLGISPEELCEAADSTPQSYARILAVLEDEALNSSLGTTVLTAYLKKRCGYDKESDSSGTSTQLSIKFEHEIFEDGE